MTAAPARKRKTGAIYRRGRVWWIWFLAPNGERVFESSGSANKAAAETRLAQRRRELSDGSWRPAQGKGGALTVNAWLDEWLDRREAAGVRGARDDRARCRDYVRPLWGDRLLADVRRADVRDLIAALTAAGKLAPRSVLHVYRTIGVAFADAVLDEKIAATPCTLKTRKGELPKKRDRDPKWRKLAVYTPAEVAALLSSPAITIDRRALYGLMLLSGMRPNEAAGRRWRDLDDTAQPLGCLTIASQADGAEGDRETKTGDVREVPVHPLLAAILADWRAAFPVYFGREPEPQDPIVPSQASRAGRSFRSATGVYEALIRDLEAAGLRRVPAARHAMRATFMTLLETSGANPRVTARFTHAAGTDVQSGYKRIGAYWPEMCAELAKLAIPMPAHGDSFCDSRPAAPSKRLENGGKMLGDTGLEPVTSTV